MADFLPPPLDDAWDDDDDDDFGGFQAAPTPVRPDSITLEATPSESTVPEVRHTSKLPSPGHAGISMDTPEERLDISDFKPKVETGIDQESAPTSTSPIKEEPPELLYNEEGSIYNDQAISCDTDYKNIPESDFTDFQDASNLEDPVVLPGQDVMLPSEGNTDLACETLESRSSSEELKLDSTTPKHDSKVDNQSNESSNKCPHDEDAHDNSSGSNGHSSPVDIKNGTTHSPDLEPLDLKPPSYSAEEEFLNDDNFGQFSDFEGDINTGSKEEVVIEEDKSVSEDSQSMDDESHSQQMTDEINDKSDESSKTPIPLCPSSEDIPALDLKKPADSGENTETCRGNDDDVRDDDGDWNFQTAANVEAEGDEEDFGDFDAFQSSEEVNNQSSNWAAFGDSTCEPSNAGGETDWAFVEAAEDGDAPTLADDDDDDFGDFESVPQPTVQPTVLSSNEEVPLTRDTKDRIIEKCFPILDSNGNTEEIDALTKLLDQEIHRTFQEPVSPTVMNPHNFREVVVDVNIWNNLKNLEETSAFRYKWKESHQQKRFLKALNMDTRNILQTGRKQPMPVFASNLGMLEPSKGPAETRQERATKTAMETPILDTTKPVANGNTPQQDIPPVEFDWGSSGLTNPLASLENELLSAVSPPQTTSNTLETLLANMNYTTTTPSSGGNKQQKLSEEAKNILKKLPNLDFMRAKFLVFPLKGNTSD